MSLLLKNAQIVDSKSPHHSKKKDIFIKNGVVESFSASPAKRVIDCKGMMISPGWCDLNADFCDPGFEHKEDIKTGTEVASRGGFCDVNLTPATSPAIESKSDVEYVLSRAEKTVDLHVSASLSEGQKGENLTEILDLHHSGARSFSDGDLPIWNTKLLLKALQYLSKIDRPIFQNARDLHISSNAQMHEGLSSTQLGLSGEPALSEELVIGRDLEILRYAGGKMHFSKVSSGKSVEMIRKAKKEGLDVTCDVALHHLLFTDEDVGVFDTMYKTLPPFRGTRDRKSLLKGIKDGTIDAISSNHRPQDQESKQLEFDLADPGAISLQTFLPSLLMIDEVPLDLLVERITHGPRRILGLEEVCIKKGSVAKLTLFDTKAEWCLDEQTNSSKSVNSPFWGHKLKGKVAGTINGDKVSMY